MRRAVFPFLRTLLVAACLALLLTRSQVSTTDRLTRLRVFTQPLEFHYSGWLWQAWKTKLLFGALNAERHMPPAANSQVVRDYFAAMGQLTRTEARLQDALANPHGVDQQQVATLRREEAEEQARLAWLAPLAEQILQTQVSAVLAENGLTFLGQPQPPLLYRTTPVPMALIVSPRTEIRQIANISLRPGLTVEQQIRLEDQVATALDVSALVVPVGGVGVYPTMVMQTDNIPWLVDTIAHEWTHNYLDWHPLGMLYGASPALRTMNETTANIVGKEIGRQVLEQFYPDQVPPPPPPPNAHPSQPSQPPAFDFRAEMHKTRVHVDQLLAAGKVAEAEAYMEARRKVFWEHGYHIRKLNQAYFAFYGAYADQPGGAAGEDPVGAAVRQLRAQSPSLADFVHTMAWLTSFDALQRALHDTTP